ncbi:hypothetical protein [Pseudoalteromonas denitrificans]|uniref:Uncharacterized protein n=1 Tax=Pseudoalteromonas denitrificans DSM 6059 TaxID=1123010 RepID=A0A1I1MYN3_9GAMM|nr:hypothetical protein [Pseudoalteromonas denitrificans]SFC87673.1 hypothetical protein SAMN02745724_02780 [Pseudoalteromonas denitrificans DSM 6059]
MKKLLLAIGISCSFNASAQDEFYLECNPLNCNTERTIEQFIDESTPLSNSSIFYISDSQVNVDSMTYQEFKTLKNLRKHDTQESKDTDSTMDGALLCENDNDFNCHDWEKEHITSTINNYLNNFQYTYTLTQQDIDSHNTAKRIHYNFVVNAITAIPAAKIGFLTVKALNYYLQHGVIATGVSGTLIGMGISETFKGYTPTNLRPGDIVVTRLGKAELLIRDGILYNIGDILTGAINSDSVGGNSGGGDGDNGDPISGGGGGASGGGGGSSGGSGSGSYCRESGSVTTGGGTTHYVKIVPCG